MTALGIPTIQLQPGGPQPTVVEGPGWIQRTPPGRGERTYRDVALGDDRWAATDVEFSSLTSILSRGIPSDWTGPAKWNVARYADTHWDDLTVDAIARDHGLRVTELCSSKGMAVEEACRFIRVGLMVDSASASLEAAADRGSAIHRAVEDLLHGSPVNRDDLRSHGALPYLLAVERFLAEAGPTAVLVESVCFDRELQVAGTCDFVGTLDHPDAPEGLLVLDWKGLALDTPLPTPTGWTTMGEVEVGDRLIGADGRPCNVVGKSGLHHRRCYRITFDDTTSIVCDDEHLWEVVALRSGTTKVLDTATIAATHRHDGKRSEPAYAVRNASAVVLPDADLLVDPYVLGVWLGDGCTGRGEVCKPDDRLWSEIRAAGHTHTERAPGENKSCTIYGLVPQLREIGVLANKHVPATYLRGSVDQRLALLQGLMDTDGQWNAYRGQAVFSTTLEHMALAVQELVVSLGWRANVWDHIAHGFGVDVREWRVAFTPFGSRCPFRARVGDVDMPDRTRSKRRIITKVEEIDREPTQCVMVDSPDSLYLCGYQMVPTHNTRAGADHDRRPKEAAQVAGYAHMLTEHYFMDDRGTRRQVAVDGAAVVTFAPDGTWGIHPVDLEAGKAHYRRSAEMARENLVSRLYGRAVKAGAPDVNSIARERLALIPAGTAARMQLITRWTHAGLGAPSKDELTVEDWPLVDDLLATAEAAFRPFPDEHLAPTVYAPLDEVQSALDELAALPVDLRARITAANAPVFRRWERGASTQDDLDDVNRLIGSVHEEAVLRRSYVTDTLGGLLDRRSDDERRLLLAGAPDDPALWTDVDVERVTALWAALDAGDLVVRDGRLTPSVRAVEDLAASGKRDAVSKAKPFAETFRRPKPQKWADLVADPLLFAAVLAA